MSPSELFQLCPFASNQEERSDLQKIQECSYSKLRCLNGTRAMKGFAVPYTSHTCEENPN
jgi:hypothetical protein